jgi:hypothetical protein
MTQRGTREDFAAGFRPLHRDFGPMSTVRSPHGIKHLSGHKSPELAPCTQKGKGTRKRYGKVAVRTQER